jgi:hypothetical protein
MQVSFRHCLQCLVPSAALLVALVACSPQGADTASTDVPQATAPRDDYAAPSPAEFEALRAEGPEGLARRMVPNDLWLHYKVMEASGMVDALGGEEKAVAALLALGKAYERRFQKFSQEDAPKLVPASFTGNGTDAAMAGLGMGAAAGMIGNGVLGSAASGMSDEQLRDFANKGPVKFGGRDGAAEVKLGEDGSVAQEMDFPVTGIDGLDGKVKVKTKMEACPDPQGKVTVDIEIESKVSVTGKPGTGGTIRAKNRYTRYLDDDAHLINGEGGSESENRIQISASGEGGDKFADVGGSFARNGTATSRNFGESGFSPFRPAEAKQAQAAIDGIGNFLNMMAEIMLRGIGKDAPWESGHCVKLDVRVNPEKRKGAKPNTQYLLFAEPKAKSDGMPTGGTVKATLKGASKLSPTDKVKAVAKFDYTNPGEEEQSASIDFEARSKRGVGRATLEFDTKKGGYQIALDNGESITTCDITKPFSGRIGGGMITLNFTPSGDKGGTMAFHFANARGMADTTYRYTLSGPEDKMTGSFQSTGAVTGQGSGRTVSAGVRKQSFTSTWTPIEDCDK